ncbi:MAG: LamG-like jellyroll fold domain-containing protein, partial [Caldilineaceae bacterium]
MSNKRTSKFGRKSVICAFMLLLGLLVSQQWWGAIAMATSAGRPMQAAAQVAQVWDNVRNSKQYDFSADVTVKTIPLATAGNIGRFSKTDSLYLEGSNNLRKQNLQMAMWGGGISVADRSAAYQVRVLDGSVQTRTGDGEWQSSNEDAAVAFAPGGDFLSFIDMAKNIVLADKSSAGKSDDGCTGTECLHLTAYTFDLDSHAYAQKMVNLYQEQLSRSGKLPLGATLQLPDHLVQTTGSGELWVDERGLPVRQKVNLSIPPAAGADNRSEAVMDIHFTNYQSDPPLLAAIPGAQSLVKALASTQLPSPSGLATSMGLFSLTLLGMALVVRPGNRTRFGVTVATLIAIVVTPTLQAQAATVALDRLSVAQTQQKELAKGTELEKTAQDIQASMRAAGPYRPPEAALNLADAVPALQSTTLDSDGDGLTDQVEALIGSNPYSVDTDFDTISDRDEVVGFSYNGKTWYGNPLWADSNNDGAIDSMEWNPSAPDSDGDGTPDLYDFDDDGDNVPDNIDISRLVASKDNGGNLIAFSQSNPLTLTVDGLQANRYTYVNLQLRPTNPNQLWYAFNVLNWPHDEKGNMQDWDNKTFFDYCKKSGGSNCNMSPDDNGDIKIVPMLEVTLPDQSSLPRTSNGAIDTDLLNKYGINVRPAGNGGYLLYAPLTLVEDSITGNKVAFSTQLIYQNAATWKPEQIRLSWLVQTLNETYNSPEAADKALKDGNGMGQDQATVLYAYYTDFYLTGLNVREDRGMDMAIVYEDPATDNNVNEDDALLQMTLGLDASFMLNRDCDLTDNAGNCIGDGQRDITIPVIKQRWDSQSNIGLTDGQRWGIAANRLRVETHSFAHEDEAIMITGSQYAPAILDAHFRNTAATKPSLLFVREQHFRASNVDVRAAGNNSVVWNGRNLTLNLGAVAETITGGYTLSPYQFDSAGNRWTRQTPEDHLKELETRYPQTNVGASTAPTVTVGEQSAVVFITMNAVQGKDNVLSQNGSTGLTSALTNSGVIGGLKGIDVSDESMRQTYIQAFSSSAKMVPYLALDNMVKSTGLTEKLWSELCAEVFTAKVSGSENVDVTTLLEDVYGSLGSVSTTGKAYKYNIETQITNDIARYRQVLVVPMLIGFTIGLILSNIKGTETAGQILLATMKAANDTLNAVFTFRNVLTTFRTLPSIGADPVALTLGFSHSLSSSTAKASAVGAVIGIVVTWALFFAAWGKGGLSTDSIEFNNLLAGAIASTVMIIITFFLSLTVVGAIIQAVFAVFDLIALIICKAGVKLACSLGISESMTKLLTEWIYTGAVMIDTKADPSITNIKDAQIRLTQPERGLVAGNSTRFQVDLYTYIRHAEPEPGVIYHWPSFFTPEDLRSTTVKYSLDNAERKIATELNQSQWPYVSNYGRVDASVPSPVVGWLVPTSQSKLIYQGERYDSLTSGLYSFNKAGINQQFSLYLNTGLALPRYDCWFGVCVHKVAKSTNSSDLGQSFILDILPATLDEFVTWGELGEQIDPDGDGLGKTIDPDQSRWDTDGDGVPDSIEYEYGIKRGYGFNPSIADADNDNLNDALEMRYQTDPRKADSDGDGIADFDEVNGYTLRLSNLTVFVTSNPLDRDSDHDGMSDGVERRLNTLDPVRYPFSPRAFNDAPARLYTTVDDADRVFAVNQNTTVTTTVLNGSDATKALLAVGTFTSTLPAQLGGAAQTRNFTLLPTTQSNIVLTGRAAAANGTFNINTALAADLVAVGQTASGPADDLILDQPVQVIIDSDSPNIPALTQGAFVQPGRTVIIGGTASDPTSAISKVEVAVNGGGLTTATGTNLWALAVDTPNNVRSFPIDVRAFDAVNNSSSANLSLNVDGIAPSLNVSLNSGELRRLQRNAQNQWTIQLSGSATDDGAGIQSVNLQIGGNSNQVITPTQIAGNGAWNVIYAFDDSSINADPSPSGLYTLTVTARDNALPDGNPTVKVIPFVIDMSPPVVTLRSHRDDDRVNDSTVFTGTVQDTYSSVAGVEYAFVDASTVFSTEETLLQLPLNDLPSTVLFRNNATNAARIFCLDQSCPTSGVSGTDGTAVSFDGNDLLRTFETLDLPESGLTTAFWFKTSCANCGLFSAIAGQYPSQTGHDRDLFLASGNVCSAVQVGASPETRCSGGKNYADNNWHQVVHTLGAGGNRLYLDGTLAVSSPTTASTFSAQDRVLVGHAAAATTPFFTGALDDFVIYNSELSTASVTTLYRRWQPATLIGNSWAFTVPSGLEGYYQIDMRAVDSLGNRGESRGDWPQLRTTIDTKLPTFDLSVVYTGTGSAATTIYSATVRDDNLSADNYQFVCQLKPDQLRYAVDPTLLSFAGTNAGTYTNTKDLAEIVAQCTRPGFQTSLVSATACDEYGHCAAALPSQAVAYLGTSQNTLSPFGTLPNAIERANLSDPKNRVRLIEREGKQILDIVVDESYSKLYWAEKTEGDSQSAGIWRANLDGNGVEQVIGGLNAYAAEALQIAIDPTGNKLYWTQGYQLWWANLDGTLKQVVYSMPPDTRFIGGALDVMQIGDVVVDSANGRLYLSERRQRLTLAEFNAGLRVGQKFKHTLIVTTDLNGANPSFFAGVGNGCAYANFYNNLGAGVGNGQDPTTCLSSGSDGFDVESMAVRNGVLYWTAVNADGVNSGVYGRAPVSTTFTVAPLALTGGNLNGLRTTPLPQLYVDKAAAGLFVTLDTQIVRGEKDDQFSRFTTFVDDTPAAGGSSRRSSSTITAMAVVETTQTVEQSADLAVGITSPSTVVVNGGSVRYDVSLRNDAALSADNTVLTVTLPSGATYSGSNGSCTNSGASITCNLDRFVGLTQRSLSISATINTTTAHPLTTTVSVASNTPERNPINNSATHSRVTAAPTLSALSGLPYVYYGSNNFLLRLPLFGDYSLEPIFLNGNGGTVMAADPTRGKMFLVDMLDNVVAMNSDGTGRVQIANANPNTSSRQDRLQLAVDESTGRIYWSEINNFVLTNIKSAKADGSDARTIVSGIVGQRGLLVDPIRRKLLWVGGDVWQRQEFIFRSDLDGSNRETVYAAQPGSLIRYLALDPYAQKIYWIDPTVDGGTLFWANADGTQVLALTSFLGVDARGLIVQPFENAVYYVSYDNLIRTDLDGNNASYPANLSRRTYDGLRLPINPTVFAPAILERPEGNIVLMTGTPFAAPPCLLNDLNEPNNSASAAKEIGVGVTTGALCTTQASLPTDRDFYTVTVPNGKTLNVTLSNLPADYDLYVQRSGVTLATSRNVGLVNDSISVGNYEGDGTYVIAVFSNMPVNNANPYSLTVALSDAPAVPLNSQCLTVDPNDGFDLAGNYDQAHATPLTVGVPITGALCYDNDVDFYKFSAAAGKAYTFDLPVRPAAYDLHLYRPDGSFFNAWSPSGFKQPIVLDASGEWKVMVNDLNGPLVRTTQTYQLLVSDGTCSLNDPWEPNNTAPQAAMLNSNLVNATLCNTSDVDFYHFSATAGQRLTVNYWDNTAGGVLRLLDADGVERGQVQPGRQGNFVLTAGGDYTLATNNSGLTSNDAPYTFYWQLDAPQATGTDYLYFANLGQLVRVALTEDHAVEVLSIARAEAGTLRSPGNPLVTNAARNKLYMVDSAVP